MSREMRGVSVMMRMRGHARNGLAGKDRREFRTHLRKG